MKIAVCPGSFDPITMGHLDIIKRAAGIFDKVIVAVCENHDKRCAFTPEERVELINRSVAGLKNVEADFCNILLADYVKNKNATVIVKGLRAMSDFEYEFQMALINKKLYDNAETIFLTARAENMYLSSSVVKQVAYYGGDISGQVPDVIKSDIVTRLNMIRKG